MNMMEIIRARRSVRTFDGQPLSEEELSDLLNFADTHYNPYGIPITWKILNAREHKLSSPVISGTDTWIAGKMKKIPGAEEAFGFAFEKVVLYAQMKGIGTTWIAGTMDRPAFEKAMALGQDEVMPCVSPLGFPAKKMSLRETMMRKGIKADSRMPFEKLFFNGSFDHPMSQGGAGSLADPLEMVRLAPSAVNKQPWRVIKSSDSIHFYEKQSKGYVGADGWDLQKIDIGIAMCHFAIGAEEKGYDLDFYTADPQIAHPADTFYIGSFKLS